MKRLTLFLLLSLLLALPCAKAMDLEAMLSIVNEGIAQEEVLDFAQAQLLTETGLSEQALAETYLPSATLLSVKPEPGVWWEVRFLESPYPGHPSYVVFVTPEGDTPEGLAPVYAWNEIAYQQLLERYTEAPALIALPERQAGEDLEAYLERLSDSALRIPWWRVVQQAEVPLLDALLAAEEALLAIPGFTLEDLQLLTMTPVYSQAGEAQPVPYYAFTCITTLDVAPESEDFIAYRVDIDAQTGALLALTDLAPSQ